MWVLINENGQVITQIPHGQIVRQGSTFHVYVAFEKNYFRKFIGREIAIYSIERLKTWVNDHIEATFSFDGTFDTYPSDSERVFFEKLTDNENLCSFKDKEWYLVFKYNGTPSQSDEYGTFNLNLRLSKIERDRNDNIISHNVEVVGPMSIYIEKTYGKKTNNNTVTREQIDELLDLINVKGKNNVIHYISDIMFESYHELAQYCLEELDLKEENRLIYADVLNNMTIATVNSQTKRVMMISADGNILCSNGKKYYYVSMPDVQILNSLIIGDDLQLLIENGDLVIKNSQVSSKIELSGISKGTLVGQPYLEKFATIKQKEAMPYLGVDPPTKINNELNQVWIDASKEEIIVNNEEDEIGEAANTFSLRKTSNISNPNSSDSFTTFDSYGQILLGVNNTFFAEEVVTKTIDNEEVEEVVEVDNTIYPEEIVEEEDNTLYKNGNNVDNTIYSEETLGEDNTVYLERENKEDNTLYKSDNSEDNTIYYE